MAHPVLDLAVKDRQGNTPFAAALAVKDSETGQAIVQRDPKAAEQVRFRVTVTLYPIGRLVKTSIIQYKFFQRGKILINLVIINIFLIKNIYSATYYCMYIYVMSIILLTRDLSKFYSSAFSSFPFVITFPC